MKNILKKINSNYILLFIFMLFGTSVQAQYNEIEPGDLIYELAKQIMTQQGIDKAVFKSDYNDGVLTLTQIEIPIPRIPNLNFVPEVTIIDPSRGEMTEYCFTNCQVPVLKKKVWIIVVDGVTIMVGAPSPPPPPPPIPQSCRQLTMANLADLVYEVDAVNGYQTMGGLPNNITIVPPSSLPNTIIFSDPNLGFNSALYKIDNGGGNIEYVYATACEDDYLNIITDYDQLMIKRNLQYDISRSNAEELASWAAVNNYKLSFTGHSLGGGLANINALFTGLEATLYNPAGLSAATMDRFDFDMSNTINVKAYVVYGEPGSYVNDIYGASVIANTVINLGETMTPSDSETLDLHSVSVLKSLINCNN